MKSIFLQTLYRVFFKNASNKLFNIIQLVSQKKGKKGLKMQKRKDVLRTNAKKIFKK